MQCATLNVTIGFICRVEEQRDSVMVGGSLGVVVLRLQDLLLVLRVVETIGTGQ